MKSHFFHLIVALAIALVVWIGYGFWYAAVSAKSNVVADLQNQITTKAETVNRVISTRATLAEISDDETAVQGYFIPEAGVVAFIDGLEAQGRNQGATVSVLSVSTDSVATPPTFILSLTIKGTFDAVMRTIGIIEYAPYNLVVSELSFIQGDKNSWQADLKIIVGSVPAAKNNL